MLPAGTVVRLAELRIRVSDQPIVILHNAFAAPRLGLPGKEICYVWDAIYNGVA